MNRPPFSSRSAAALLAVAWLGAMLGEFQPRAATAADGITHPRKTPAYLAGALAENVVQPIYSDDVKDPWNRIFHSLFTRTLKIRLSEDFPEGAPFEESKRKVKVSTRIFERVESGDGAMEPLYPHEHFRAAVSAAQVLAEPRFPAFRQALEDALAEPKPRPALDRALMQSDLWAAYDILSKDVTAWILKDAPIPLYVERQGVLRGLLARMVKKVALSAEEIDALPDNYAKDSAALKFPDLFGEKSEWLELDVAVAAGANVANVAAFAQREHERATYHRRVTRVFLLPAEKPRDRQAFLRALLAVENAPKIAAAALVTQHLLVDRAGEVRRSPLTAALQVRRLDEGSPAGEARFVEFALSRRALLKGAPALRRCAGASIPRRKRGRFTSRGREMITVTPRWSRTSRWRFAWRHFARHAMGQTGR